MCIQECAHRDPNKQTDRRFSDLITAVLFVKFGFAIAIYWSAVIPGAVAMAGSAQFLFENHSIRFEFEFAHIGLNSRNGMVEVPRHDLRAAVLAKRKNEPQSLGLDRQNSWIRGASEEVHGAMLRRCRRKSLGPINFSRLTTTYRLTSPLLSVNFR